MIMNSRGEAMRSKRLCAYSYIGASVPIAVSGLGLSSLGFIDTNVVSVKFKNISGDPTKR